MYLEIPGCEKRLFLFPPLKGLLFITRLVVYHKRFMFHMVCKEFRKGFLNVNTTTATNEITTVIRPRITGMADCTPQSRARTLTPLTRCMEHSHRVTPKMYGS